MGGLDETVNNSNVPVLPLLQDLHRVQPLGLLHGCDTILLLLQLEHGGGLARTLLGGRGAGKLGRGRGGLRGGGGGSPARGRDRQLLRGAGHLGNLS